MSFGMIFAQIKENEDVMHGEQQQEEDQSINHKLGNLWTIIAYDQQAPYPLVVKFMDEYVGTNYLTKSAK